MSADTIADTEAGTSPTRETLARLLRHRSFVIGGAFMLVIAIIAAGADWLAPFDPLRNNFRMRLHAPDAINWFGTDHFGRDIMSRMMFGARTSLDHRRHGGGRDRHLRHDHRSDRRVLFRASTSR